MSNGPESHTCNNGNMRSLSRFLEEKQDYMEMPMFRQKSRETAAPLVGFPPVASCAR